MCCRYSEDALSPTLHTPFDLERETSTKLSKGKTSLQESDDHLTSEKSSESETFLDINEII